MSVITEGMHTGEYIVSEANGTRSREAGKLAAGNDLEAGTVLGQVTDSSVVTADGGNAGDGVAGAATIGSEGINGTYTLTCTNAGVSGSEIFSVVTPIGEALAELTVAVAYVSSHINITIADGAADFEVGDIFTIDVILGEYGEFNAGASDGTEVAKAILYASVDATSVEQTCVVSKRDCEVNGGELTWKSGTTEVQKATAIASLTAVGILVR